MRDSQWLTRSHGAAETCGWRHAMTPLRRFSWAPSPFFVGAFAVFRGRHEMTPLLHTSDFTSYFRLYASYFFSRTEDAEDAETTQTHRHSMPGALAPVAWNLPGVMDSSWAPSPFFVGAMQ